MTFGTSAGGIGFGVALQLYDFFTGPAYRIQRSMQSLNLATTDFARSMNRQMNAVKATFAAFAGAAGVVAMAAVPGMMAAKYDAMKAQFEVMLGSAKTAENTLIQLRQFAKTTPFGMEETISAAKRLLAFGIPLKDLMSDMRMLGDVATAVGKENLDPIILAYGQARVKGFLMGDELRQFAERSVPFMDYIKQYFKETEGLILDGIQSFDKIKSRQITFKMMRDMLKAMTSEGGRFANMMERMEGRPLQLLDRIGGEFYELGLKFGEAVMQSGAPMLKLLAGISETLNDMAPTVVGEIAVQIGLLAGSVASLATAAYLLTKAPSLAKWLAGTYTEAMGYSGLSHFLFNPDSAQGSSYKTAVTRLARMKAAQRKDMVGSMFKMAAPTMVSGGTGTVVGSTKATFQELYQKMVSGTVPYEQFPLQLGPFTRTSDGKWKLDKGYFDVPAGKPEKNTWAKYKERKGLTSLQFAKAMGGFLDPKRLMLSKSMSTFGAPMAMGTEISHQDLLHIMANRTPFAVGGKQQLFRPDPSTVHGPIAGYQPTAPGMYSKPFVKTYQKPDVPLMGFDPKRYGRTMGMYVKKITSSVIPSTLMLGQAMLKPYKAAGMLGKQVQKLGNLFAPLIGKLILMGAIIGILVAGYLKFQDVLKGTAAPAEGLTGLLQRIGGAISGIYELTMSWNGEVGLMSFKMARALARLGILETVAKMSVFFIRLKEILMGAMHGFGMVFKVVGTALSYVVYGIAKVMSGFAKLLGYSDAVAVDIRIWRAFGAVVGVYLAGAALRAAWSFGVMAVQALKAALVTNLGFAPMLFTILAISAAVVGLLVLFGQMSEFDMEEPFSRFATGNDMASKGGSADYFVKRDYIPSIATKERIKASQVAQEEERIKAYYANERPQKIEVYIDKKVLASSVKDAFRTEEAR